ncbi:recombinase family protein [Actinokineospora iranica]|uniref:Recombinase zinc beta ribbon domain-containing protein n=1 Tax=Actinokineospora iranica TaxID=1271860 RepID=A0A1G6JNN0_9PSEU|nr:recombinase family protein [Actinokineospora iranica]SDC20313.1 Recombinase zinc beta ribbon domain-containing protein [Actinokineospora iranica]
MSTPRRKVTAGQDADRPLVLDSYGRLSRVPETGEIEKIETQWADNRKVIDRVGAVLGEELKDGLSAWKRTVRRPGWEQLLERVESGASDGIVVWHTDRLFRQPRDLEKLIELGERGFKVFSAHGERDLANADDRFILRIEVAQAAKSSDDMSRRIKRRFSTYREQGKVTGGPRRFGFPGKDQTWKPGPGQTKADQPDVSAELVERERQAIRDAAADLLTEVNYSKIAREWNAAGLLTAAGRDWVPNTVRDTMQRPTLGGVIEHHGETAGRLAGDAILDQRTYERLRALFAGRKRGRKPGQVYIGSGLLRCGNCGAKMAAGPETGKFYKDGTQRARYYCPTYRYGCGKVFIDVGHVDEEIKVFVVSRLSDKRHAQAVSAARSQVAERLAEVNAEIADCEALQRGLSERLGKRKMTLDAFDEANEPLVSDLARLYAERDSLSGGNPDGPTEAQSKESLIAQWNAGLVPDKRAMFVNALGRDRLVIDRYTGPRGKIVFDKARVRLEENENNPADAE